MKQLMQQLKYAALLATIVSTLALLSPVGALARDKNQHSVQIPATLQVGSTQLEPGNYKVEWQGTGPDVQVNFVRNGKTVATVPGTLNANDKRVVQDAIVTDTASSTLKEIDFGRDKESVTFGSSGM